MIDFNIVRGYVIGKEACSVYEQNDYWLIDLTSQPGTVQYGDTLQYNGTEYANVVKVKTLSENLKKVGLKVRFDFKIISKDRSMTTDCNISKPDTFYLKELYIISQGEVR